MQATVDFHLPDDVQGLIFDLDGTLADTIPSHISAFEEVFRRGNATVELAYLLKFSGVSDVQIFEAINRDLGYEFVPEEAARLKERLFLEKYIVDVTPIRPVLRIAERYRGLLPMAVATGGVRTFAEQIMAAIDVVQLFDVVVTVEDVAHGKPSPDIFLEAASRLAVSPASCHVFEDSATGMEAAKRAGMSATDIRTLISRSDLDYMQK